MNIEQLKLASHIQQRLHEIDIAQRRLQESHTLHEIAAFAGCYGDRSTGVIEPTDIPPAVFQFIRSCGDVLATEKAALEAEFAAL